VDASMYKPSMCMFGQCPEERGEWDEVGSFTGSQAD